MYCNLHTFNFFRNLIEPTVTQVSLCAESQGENSNFKYNCLLDVTPSEYDYLEMGEDNQNSRDEIIEDRKALTISGMPCPNGFLRDAKKVCKKKSRKA